MPDDWVFLTNHAHVLLCVASDHEMRLRDIADEVGITERAAQRIVTELVASGYLTKRRVGRRNCYDVNPDAPLRRVSHRHHTVGEVLELLGPMGSAGLTQQAQPARSVHGLEAPLPASHSK
jgi:DNA-binding IscR family transcriptional regulator